MIILGILIPVLILLMGEAHLRSWRLVRLFSSYLVLYTIFHLVFSSFELGLFPQALFLFFMVVMETSNIEHVINNNANQNYIFFKFLLDPVFLKGSGLSKGFFLRFLGVLLAASISLIMSPKLEISTLLIMMALSFLLTLIIPLSSVLPDWMQESWIMMNLKNLFLTKTKIIKIHLRADVKLSTERLAEADAKYASLRPKEVGEGKWLEQKSRPNVLLIIVEGLGEVHLKKGWLPKLAQRRSQNLSLKTFITHQRNTNRGLYSLFSGKHPNLINQMAKPDLVAQYGQMDKGIGEILQKQNYQTVYLQGAPSVFMCKDRFLPELGFQEVLGEEKFPPEVSRIKWGVDDQQLYKQAFSKIKELNKGEPWFLSLLTVSTHHPIEASNKVLKNLEDGFRYADEELDQFLNQLEGAGIFESTLICITSDEVAGDGDHVLSESLGPLIMLTPDKIKKEITIPFCQSDLAYSLCDYLNIEQHPFPGRSIFRNYAGERPLYFASIFQQKAFLYSQKHLYIQHYSGQKELLGLEDLSLSSIPTHPKEDFEQGFLELNHFVAASDRGLTFLTTPVIMDLNLLGPNGHLMVKSPGFIKVGLKKGEKIKLQFQGENLHPHNPLVVNWLIQDMKHKRSFKPNLILVPNSQEAYEKVFVSPGDSWYDLTIRVMANDNQQWLLKDLQISTV